MTVGSTLFKNIPYLLILLTIFSVIYDVCKKENLSDSVEKEILRYMVGGLGLWAAISHTVFAQRAAKAIGWKSGGFQWEVGMTNLSLGVLGIMASLDKYKGNFRKATIIFVSIQSFGAAVNHIREIIQYKNFSPNNVGIMLIIDIVVPLILILINLKN